MIQKETRRTETSLVGVVQTLTEDVVSLFREHLTLFRVELKRDTAIAARYAFALAFFAVISLMGFALFWSWQRCEPDV